ncbi:MAG TPA: hypothetical protein PLO53_03190 [Candidatus Hydrogenedentes bacterium]|nr:hypothetical protein [Candidatus Hydrogenedentota bacterium]
MGKGKAILFPTVIFVAIFSITGWTDEPAKPDSVSDGDSSSSYADIEQQINELKKENAALESQETRLNAENSEIAGRIEERERIGFIIESTAVYESCQKYLSGAGKYRFHFWRNIAAFDVDGLAGFFSKGAIPAFSLCNTCSEISVGRYPTHWNDR